MMYKHEQVADGIIAFADNEILPQMKGMEMWLAAAALVSARNRLDVLMPVLTENKVVAMLGVIQSDGTIDVDTAIETAKTVSRKHGALLLDIPLIGEIHLTETDFDKLKKYINEAGG